MGDERVMRSEDSGLRSRQSILASGMSPASFDALISHLELRVPHLPSWCRWRVALLTISGHGLIGILLQPSARRWLRRPLRVLLTLVLALPAVAHALDALQPGPW